MLSYLGSLKQFYAAVVKSLWLGLSRQHSLREALESHTGFAGSKYKLYQNVLPGFRLNLLGCGVLQSLDYTLPRIVPFGESVQLLALS